MQFLFKTIVACVRPSFDQIVAIWLITRFWLKSELKIAFVEEGNSATEFPRDTIVIGIGRGQFGSRSSKGNGESTSALVAKHLKVDKDSTLKDLLEYASGVDSQKSTTKTNGLFDVATRIKTMYSWEDEEVVVRWAFVALDDIYKERVRFYSEEFIKKAEIVEFESKGKRMVIASLISDETMMNKVARSKDINIFIQKRSSGNVQIFSKGKCLDIGSLARLLRIEEDKLAGTHLNVKWETLETAEKIPGLPEWYFPGLGGNIFNGTLVFKTSPTRISLGRIVELTVLVFDRGANCKCEAVSKVKCKKCKDYRYGFHHCRKERKKFYELP